MTVAHLREDAYEDVVKAMAVANEKGKQEPGCIYYNVFKSERSPFTTVTMEMWEDKESFEAHCQGDACKELGSILDPALVGVEIHEGYCMY